MSIVEFVYIIRGYMYGFNISAGALFIDITKNKHEYMLIKQQRCIYKHLLDNTILASCPWGPVTANGVDILTEMYVIYMERKLLGPTVLVLQA